MGRGGGRGDRAAAPHPQAPGIPRVARSPRRSRHAPPPVGPVRSAPSFRYGTSPRLLWTVTMRRGTRYLVVVVLALLTCGCGALGAGLGGGDGYLLYEDAGDAGAVQGVEFVDKGDGRIGGSMQRATPGEPNVNLSTTPITGTVDGTNIAIEEGVQAEGGAPGKLFWVQYQGTLEGGNMRLTKAGIGMIFEYEGEEATLEDFGAAAQDLATEEP